MLLYIDIISKFEHLIRVKMKELQKQIIHIVTERLNKYGFIKRCGGFFVREKDDNVLQQIEFHTCYYHPIKSITPHVGVLYKDEFNLLRKYFDYPWPFPNYKYSTYSNALMNMMDRIDWQFAKGDDITPIVNNMIESIMEIGISYIDTIFLIEKILFQKWKIEKLRNQHLI